MELDRELPEIFIIKRQNGLRVLLKYVCGEIKKILWNRTKTQ